MYIRLSPAVADALVDLAHRERRDPRDQAALIVTRSLARRGLVDRTGARRLNDDNRRRDRDVDAGEP